MAPVLERQPVKLPCPMQSNSDEISYKNRGQITEKSQMFLDARLLKTTR